MAVLLASVAVAGLAAPQAGAATAFQSVGSFGEQAPDGVTLRHQGRVAVELSSGNVLVTDVVNDRVGVWAPNGTGADLITTFGAGELVDPFGLAVDQSSGDVYVSDAGNGRVVRYASNGLPVPTYTRDLTYAGPPAGGGVGEVGDFMASLALDPASGKLWVADSGSDTVERYATDGSYDGLSIDGSGSPSVFMGVQDVAVDSTGDVLVVDSDGGDPADGAAGRVERFDDAGVWEQTLGPVDNAATVAVRPGTDEVIVSGNQDAVNDGQPVYPTITVFDGSESVTFDLFGHNFAAGYSTVSGIAADDGTSGQLFVGTDTSRGSYPASYGIASVQVLDPIVPAAPVVEPPSASASSVTARSATLHATVDPNNAETSYHFEYGPTDSYGSQTDPASAGAGGDPVEVSAALEGLEPGTTYHFRVVADNGIGGPVQGSDQTFDTAPLEAPIVDVAAASGITATGATLSATIDPGYSETTYRFEYGTTDSYGTQTASVTTGSGTDPVTVSTRLKGLDPATTYHYRLVADNAVGDPVESPDQTFDTAVPTPIVETTSATLTSPSTVTVAGTVDTWGLAGTATVSVSRVDGGYSNASAPIQLTATDGAQQIAAEIGGLPAGGTFTARVAAQTAQGQAGGQAIQFTTPPSPGYTPPASPPDGDDTPYGCRAPALHAYRATARPGERITLTGTDLGLHGRILIGGQRAVVHDYTPTSVTVTVPTDAKGVESVAIDCGNRSKTISIQVARAARLSLTGRVVGLTAKLQIRVPARGRVSATGRRLVRASKVASSRGRIKLTLRLTNAGRQALTRSANGRLRTRITIRFTPTGGRPTVRHTTVTFNRKGGR